MKLFNNVKGGQMTTLDFLCLVFLICLSMELTTFTAPFKPFIFQLAIVYLTLFIRDYSFYKL